MNARLRAIAIMAACCLSGVTAIAQEIHWPRIGRPAITVPGATFELEITGDALPRLEQAGRAVPLDITWQDSPSERKRGRCAVPDDLAPGRYDLALDGAVPRRGAVFVLASYPPEYALAIVRGTRPPNDEQATSVLPPDFASALKAVPAQLAIVIGPLTASGSDEAYAALEDALLAVDLPVFVSPDSTDLRSGNYKQHFGGSDYGVRFGEDGYLFLGAGLQDRDAASHGRLGEAYRLRRAMRACRWSFGVAGRYELDWDMRAQIALFADDPLNYLIAGTVLPDFGDRVPWGKTVYLPAPAAPRNEVLVFDVSHSGIKLHVPVPAAAAE